MKLSVLAVDYDGTIARDGRLDPRAAAALAAARRRGIAVLLVTGRRMADLRDLLGDLSVFDAVVGENGAVLSFPRNGRSFSLAPHAPPAFVDALRARGIDVRVGESVVEVAASDAHQVLDEVRRRELPLALLFNRSRLMVLPQAVSKATGLREALAVLRRSSHNTLAVGDAENDHELLLSCEIGLAVAWGSPALLAVADGTIAGAGPEDVGAGLMPLIERGRLPIPPRPRRRLLLGQTPEGERVELAVLGRTLLVAGDPRSGKSWVTGLLAEQLILHRYSVCVIDPEGDYRGLESMPGVRVLGGGAELPAPAELLRALAYPDVSVVLDLSHAAHADKADFIRAALRALVALRRRTGLPHRIIVDEAHYFLGEGDAGDLSDADNGGYTLATYRATRLASAVLDQVRAIVVTRETDADEVAALARYGRWSGPVEELRRVLGSLDLHEAVLLPLAAESGGRLLRVHLAPRLTTHVRHRTKYLDVPVPHTHAFVFSGEAAMNGLRARSLNEFAAVLARTSGPAVDRHLHSHDFSRWIDEVFGDHSLAADVRAIEERYIFGLAADVTGEIVHAVRRRYLPELRSEGESG